MMQHQTDPWRAEVRRQAYVAVQVATTRHEAATHVLGYYLRRALAHGLTIEQVCEASDLDRARVLELTDPAVAA